jgi:hypothetical protein
VTRASEKGRCFMAIKGELETFYLTTILQLLDNEQKTGVLEVRDGVHVVKIFFHEGTIIYATSSEKKYSLGNLLRRKGILSKVELEKCLALAKKKKQKLGSVLVEKGHISTEGLKSALHYQVKEILYNLFIWKTGEFEYRDKPLNVEGKLITQMNTMSIVLEATRRIDEWSVLKKVIPNDQLVFKVSGKNQGRDNVTKNEWRILSLINGRRTLRKLIDESGYSDFAAFKIVYSLMMSGLIEIIEQPQKKETESFDYSSITNIYNDILQVIHKDLESEIGKRVFTLFDECKAELAFKQRNIFNGFDISKKVTTNLQGVLEGMASFKGYEEGYAFLIKSFNSLLSSLLTKEIELVGPQITGRTLKELEQTLSYIREYQDSSYEKTRILHQVEKTLEEVRRGIERQD